MSKHTTKELPPTPKKKEQLLALCVFLVELLTALLEADNHLSSMAGWEMVMESPEAAQRPANEVSLGIRCGFNKHPLVKPVDTDEGLGKKK